MDGNLQITIVSRFCSSRQGRSGTLCHSKVGVVGFFHRAEIVLD